VLSNAIRLPWEPVSNDCGKPFDQGCHLSPRRGVAIGGSVVGGPGAVTEPLGAPWARRCGGASPGQVSRKFGARIRTDMAPPSYTCSENAVDIGSAQVGACFDHDFWKDAGTMCYEHRHTVLCCVPHVSCLGNGFVYQWLAAHRETTFDMPFFRHPVQAKRHGVFHACFRPPLLHPL
jgi:hypothetical protein